MLQPFPQKDENKRRFGVTIFLQIKLYRNPEVDIRKK